MQIEELFDPDFIERTSRLKILARRVAPRGSPAEKRSRQQGSGMEFRDYRPYTPGDDFRSIDWNVYQRLGRVFLRLFEEQRDLPVYLVVDRAAGMFQGEFPRSRAAFQVAFALAAIALQEHDSVGVFPFSDTLEVAMRPSGGKGRLMRVAQTLVRVTPGGETNFSASMAKLRGLRLRPGLMVVISDFFDPAGLEAVRESLKTIRHTLLFVQLVRKSDAAPPMSGDLLLRDCETGVEENISMTRAVLDSYLRGWTRFQEELGAMATAMQAGLLRLDVEEEVTEQLAQLFEKGALVV